MRSGILNEVSITLEDIERSPYEKLRNKAKCLRDMVALSKSTLVLYRILYAYSEEASDSFYVWLTCKIALDNLEHVMFTSIGGSVDTLDIQKTYEGYTITINMDMSIPKNKEKGIPITIPLGQL